MSAAGFRHAAVLAAAALVAACAATPTAAPAAAPMPPASRRDATSLELRNAGFEDGMKDGQRCAIGWDCTMHNNPDAFRFSLLEAGAAAGRRSLCVERVVVEPWSLVTQAFQTPALRGRRLTLSMQVLVEGASGDGAGPWILAQGRPAAHAARLVKGTAGWQRVSVQLDVPPDATVVQVGATLEGPGRACFDDVRVDMQ